MKTIALIFLLPTCWTIAKAQNVQTSTIRWDSQTTLNADSGQQTEETTFVVTHQTGSIEWKNANGSAKKSFQIIEAIGEWPDASQPGWIQYEVTDGNVSGTISIKKNETETKVFISLASAPIESYVLLISGLQVL